LEGEINRFFERTGEQDYGTVGKAMKEERVAEQLLKLTEKIASNHAALAVNETRKWEKRFEEWASLLDNLEEGGGGGSSGGGAMSEAALRRLLALLRLRQQEQNVRDHTRLLEARRESNQGYREDAIILSIRQMYLKEDVQALLRQGESRYLPQVRNAMEESETFLTRPQTDPPVVDAQTDAVNLLEAEVTDMLQMSQGASLAAAMGMMMQMMGMSPGGVAAGGNMSGGNTDQPSLELEGEVRGAAGEERSVERTSGRSTRPVPVEYRKALQQYHRALEELEADWKGGAQ
jgi:hypothetical protein